MIPDRIGYFLNLNYSNKIWLQKSGQSPCNLSPQGGATHLVMLSREARLAAKKYNQTTPLLALSAMAAETGNWIRPFSFSCESLRSIKKGKTEPRLL